MDQSPSTFLAIKLLLKINHFKSLITHRFSLDEIERFELASKGK